MLTIFVFFFLSRHLGGSVEGRHPSRGEQAMAKDSKPRQSVNLWHYSRISFSAYRSKVCQLEADYGRKQL